MSKKIKLVLLSGGSGIRLWPLSNEARSKQFLKLFKRSDCKLESMCQRILRQIKQSKLYADVTIATNARQYDSVVSQLEKNIDIVTEPECRNTFPAIVLASFYLYDKKNCDNNDVVVFIPIDAFVEDNYFDVIGEMANTVSANDVNIILMGIAPTYPSSKFGYILPEQIKNSKFKKVMSFEEKPNEGKAQKLIACGGMWNGGAFAFKLGYIRKIARKFTDIETFDTLRTKYSALPSESFDCAVLEHEDSIGVIEYKGLWKDLGTWDSLTEEIANPYIGNAIIRNSEGTNVINELPIPIICLGMQNAIVAASPDGILVSDKKASAGLKNCLKNIKSRPMYEERRWGEYSVMGFNKHSGNMRSLTKLLKFKDGGNISYQYHNARKEIWTVVNGKGMLVLNDKIKQVIAGDVIVIEQGHKHAIKAISDLQIIEVQIGQILTEDDIVRIPFDWINYL